MKLSANGTSSTLRTRFSVVVATKAATILKGKHKPQYTPHVDTGDFVIIINADKVRVTGTKAAEQALLSSHRSSGRTEVRDLRRGHGQAPRARHRACRQGHAAEEHAGPCAGHEAQGVRWCRAPAYGSEAASRSRWRANPWRMKHCTTAPVVVRTLSLACVSFPAPAR